MASKFLKAWEAYKADYPNRKTKSVRVPENREKFCFLDYHDGIAYMVWLTESGYMLEKIPTVLEMRLS